MDKKLWQEAQKLAHQHYDVTVETDTLSNGRLVYVLRHPDLPGCIAQGFSMDEAQSNLDAARFDHIYALLMDGMDVPHSHSVIRDNEEIVRQRDEK